jgi:tetratricopeptide (TPR) repeat protein
MPKLSINQALLKASAHVRIEEVDAAKRLYNAVLKLFPENKRARSGLAALTNVKLSKGSGAVLLADINRMAKQLNRGDVEPVLKDATEWLKKQDDNAALWNIYGKANARIGRQKQAERAFQKALKLEPHSVDTLGNLAAIYQAADELDAAIEYYQRALSIAPNAPNSLVRMGNALTARGDLDAAQQCFEKVLSGNPANVQALSALVGLLQLRQEYTRAVACFERLLKLAPDILPKNIMNVPVGYLSSDLLQKLQENFDRIDVEDTGRVDVMFIQASLERHRGDVHKAFDSYCVANMEKLKTVKDDITLNEGNRKKQLELLRQWTPKSTTKPAGVQTLIILGPSRSGKTTLEAMLQSSPHVDSAHEAWRRRGRLSQIADMPAKTQFLLQRGAKENDAVHERQNVFNPLTIEEIFYKSEDTLIAEGKHVLTATSPALVNHVASLTDLLPGVCFCYVKRNPAEIAAQIFARTYRKGNNFSYGPVALLSYLNWYSEMWNAMSGKVRGIALDFEDIVSRPQQVVEQIEAMLGQDLQAPDLVPVGFSTIDPFAELFAQRFMSLGSDAGGG